MADGEIVGVEGGLVVSSVDNGFNNLESAIGPVAGRSEPGTGLNQLARLVFDELVELGELLAQNNAGILGLSQHPDLPIDEMTYRRLRAPRPIYKYWTDIRGWRHACGIDAKAQNGPTTGVSVPQAVEALNIVLLSAPAMIALFANSPFEAGEPTGFKETRLTIWPRMFGASRMAGDDTRHLPPERPFSDLTDYFGWMFGADTAMQALSRDGNTYKGFDNLLRIEGDPSLLAFLSGPPPWGHSLDGGDPMIVTPHMHHLEMLQYSQFLDGRIRFHFAEAPTIPEFILAMSERTVEELFAVCCGSLYIEGRACGATFADEELRRHADPRVAGSAVMAASALQKGLLAKSGTWGRLACLLPWDRLREARDNAIRFGLDGEAGTLTLHAFASAILEEAMTGLPKDEHWMLAYPLHVLRTRQTGADRAIARFEALNGDRRTRIRKVTLERIVRSFPQML